MLRPTVIIASLASAAAFAPMPLATNTPSVRSAQTCVRASRFGQFADPSAPPADLFNIWRDDYMLSPQQAAAEAAERAQNTLFDGVLPPFSNVGNTDRDQGIDQTPRLRGEGISADFSTANPTSAYDVANFGKTYVPRAGILPSAASGLDPEQAALAKKASEGVSAPKKGSPVAGRKGGLGGLFGRK